MIQETVLNFEEDIHRFIQVLPTMLGDYMLNHKQLNNVYEVVMDLGQPPAVRFGDDYYRLTDFPSVTIEDIADVTEKVGMFNSDNRAGIEQTLHRISAIRNRQGTIIGLSLRVGRAVIGSIQLIEDLIKEGKSVLILGPPGVGKTTKLRESARFLSSECNQRVMVIDTSNEIGGEGDVPHRGIGYSRRMQVGSPEIQDRVMIEAVENHTPQVIIVDEIGTELEARAARTIAERGVQLIGTAHGDDFVNVLKNPTLSDLLGGIQSVILGDEEARLRGTQKTVLERKSPPTFDFIVEIKNKDAVLVYKDVAMVVDLHLRGEEYQPEIRQVNQGEIVTEDEVIHWSDQYGPIIGYPSDSVVSIYPFGINKGYVTSTIRDLNVAADVAVVVSQADVLLTTASQLKNNQKIRDMVKNHQVQVHAVHSNSQTCVQGFLRNYFNLPPSDSDVQDDVMSEIRHLCDRVIAEKRVLDAAPRSSYHRRMQHKYVLDMELTSLSIGQEPNRRVRIYPKISR